MKRIMGLVLVLILSLSGFALAEEAPAMAVTDEAALQLYAPVLDMYRTSVTERWDVGQLDEHEMSYSLAYIETAREDLGYRLIDVDGDGSPELLIGLIARSDIEVENILGMYTLENYQPKLVMIGWDRCSYFLLDDMTLLNYGSNSAYSGGRMLYALKDGELTVLDAVIHDYELNEAEPFFRTQGSWEAADGEHMTNEEADTLVQGWESRVIRVGYLPLFED